MGNANYQTHSRKKIIGTNPSILGVLSSSRDSDRQPSEMATSKTPQLARLSKGPRGKI